MKWKLKLSTSVELGVGAAAIAAILLAGCGGGGGSAVSSSMSTELSGIASKGPVANGTITAFSISANGQKDKAIASTTSDSSGSYTLKLGA